MQNIMNHNVVHSREDEKVGVAHEEKSPKNQPQFSQTTIGHYWWVKLNPNKLSDQPKILSKSCHRILKISYLTEFSD